MRKTFETPDITVHWDSTRCIDTAICLRTLPCVFYVERRPWIDTSAASADEIAGAVVRCPTGAPTFTSPTLPEPVVSPPSMRPIRGGPMIVQGEVEIVDRAGDVIARESRMALCRCGNCGNQPFCDNSHRADPFEEPEPKAPATAEAPNEICTPQPGFTTT